MLSLESLVVVFFFSLNSLFYRPFRFGIVEGDKTRTKLFTTINPLVRQKPPNPTYICKWDTERNTIEKIVTGGQQLLSQLTIS